MDIYSATKAEIDAAIEAARANAVKQYTDDGSSLNNIITDLSATSEELSATATSNIAEKNMLITKNTDNINRIMAKNKEVSEKLEKIVAMVEI